MRPLTDLEVLALLAAAPVDSSGATMPSTGFVTPAEHYAAKGAMSYGSVGEWGRLALARVFGLPPREADEPIMIALAWESDRERSKANAARAKEALDRVTTDGPSHERIEALCSEVLELRANAAAILRADVGPESERSISEHSPDDEPTVEIFIDPAELAQAEADRAAAACFAPKPTDEEEDAHDLRRWRSAVDRNR